MTEPGADATDRPVWTAVGWLLLGVALGSLAYRVVLEAMLDAEWVQRRPEYFRAGGRDALLDVGPWIALALGLVVVVLAWRSEGRPRPALWAGGLLTGLGGAFAAWGIVDMHGLGLYDWAGSGSDLLPDALFHGAGALVLALGWVLLTEATGSRRR